MTFSTPELGLEETLSVAQRFGYDGVELRLDADHKHGVEVETGATEREEMRRKIEDGDVPVCCLATSCRFADPANAAEQVDDALDRIQLAGDMGVSRIRVFGGSFPEEVSRDRAIETVVESLKSMADNARSNGVTVCMETHDAWCDPFHVAAVMEAVDHPNIGVNWDIMHPVRTGHATVEESFETLKRWIAHIHFHDGADIDGKLTMMPIGTGIIDHRIAVGLLKECGYDGYLSGEWINWESWEVHLPREIATMRSYE
jgi:sugar phosphate isomerase/epimerase